MGRLDEFQERLVGLFAWGSGKGGKEGGRAGGGEWEEGRRLSISLESSMCPRGGNSRGRMGGKSSWKKRRPAGNSREGREAKSAGECNGQREDIGRMHCHQGRTEYAPGRGKAKKSKRQA